MIFIFNEILSIFYPFKDDKNGHICQYCCQTQEVERVNLVPSFNIAQSGIWVVKPHKGPALKIYVYPWRKVGDEIE